MRFIFASVAMLALAMGAMLWNPSPTDASSHLRWAGRTDETTKTFAQGGGGGQQWISSAEGGTGNITYKMHLKSDPTQGLPEGFGFGSGSARTRLQWSSSALDDYMAKTAYIWTATDSADPPASITLEFTIEITATTPTKPYAGGQARDGTMILGWGGVEHVNGYEYNLSESTSFSQNNWKTVPNSNGATDRHTFADGSDDDLELKDNRRYYVKVRGVNGPGGGVKGPESDTVNLRNVVDPSFTDYDTDDDGLIEISSPGQLDAIKHDLDGDGLSTRSDQYMGLPDPNPGNEGKWIVGFFPRAALNMGCPDSGCIGYELTADLNLRPDTTKVPLHNDGEVNGWRALGTSEVPFRGTFDGNGKTIDNLIRGRFLQSNGRFKDAVSFNATNIRAGLFGVVSETGVIRNVNLTNVNVVGRTRWTDKNDYTTYVGQPIGALVAENWGTVENSTASGRVHRMFSNSSEAFNLHLKSTYHNTHTNRNVFWDELDWHNTNASMGGLVGNNRGKIIGSGANVDVRGPGIIGGLVGVNRKLSQNEDNRDTGQIVNSYATGYVEVDGTSMGGGLVGFNHWGNISGSYASGDIYTAGRAAAGENVAVGGLAGVIHGRGTLISKSYATGDVTNRGSNADGVTHYQHLCYAGGLVGHAYHTDFQSDRKGNQMRIEDSYSSGNVAYYHTNTTSPQGYCSVGVVVGFVNSGTKLQLYNTYGVGVVRDQTNGDGGGRGYTFGIIGFWGRGPAYLTGSHSGAHPEMVIDNSYFEIQRTTIDHRRDRKGSHKNEQDMRFATADDRRGVYNGWSTDVWDFRDDDGHTYPELKVDWNGDGVATSDEFAAEGDDLGAQPHSYLWLEVSERQQESPIVVDLNWTIGDDSVVVDSDRLAKWQYRSKVDTGDYGDWTDVTGSSATTTTAFQSDLSGGSKYYYRVRAMQQRLDDDGNPVLENGNPVFGQVGLESNEVSITVSDAAPTFGSATIPDQVYLQNTDIQTLTLPEATGGNGTLTYAVTPDLPRNLTFDATNRTITGKSIGTLSKTEYTYKVTDADAVDPESAEIKFNIQVNARLGFGFACGDIVAHTFFLNTPVDVQLGCADGGVGPITHTLTNIPPGLTFHSDTRRITGAPTQTWSKRLASYKARTEGVYGETQEIFINMEVKGCTFGTQTIDDLVYTVGVPVPNHALPHSSGACDSRNDTTIVRQLLDGDGQPATPPAGLSIPATGNDKYITGTPSEAMTSVTYVWRATVPFRASLGRPTLSFRIYSALALPAITDDSKTYIRGEPITTLTLPASTGGVGTDRTYSFSPALPDGLSYDADSREITGTPTQATTPRTHTISVTDEEDNTASRTLTIEVTQTTVPRVSNQIMPPDEAIETLTLPEATGGKGAYTYTLTPNLPDGLTFDATARTITGTPPRFSGALTFTYAARDENQIEGSTTFRIRNFRPEGATTKRQPEFSPEPFMDGGMDSLTFTVNERQSVTLPEQTGDTGDDPVTYALISRYGDPGLPAGLTFDGATRRLSGTPEEPQDSKQYVYLVKSEEGEDSFIITIAIASASQTEPTPEPAPAPGPQLPSGPISPAPVATPAPVPMPVATMAPVPATATPMEPAPVPAPAPADPAPAPATAVPQAMPQPVATAEPTATPMPTTGNDRGQVLVMVPTSESVPQPADTGTDAVQESEPATAAETMAQAPAATPLPAADPGAGEPPTTEGGVSEPLTQDGDGGNNLWLIIALVVLALVIIGGGGYLVMARRR